MTNYGAMNAYRWLGLRSRAAWVGTALFASVALAGCSESSSETERPLTEQIQGDITLAPFASCGDLESHLKDQAKSLVDYAFDNASNGYYGGGWGVDEDLAVGAPTAGDANDGPQGEPNSPEAPASPQPGGDGGGESEEAGDDGAGGGGGLDFTGTNNQELEVDEADIVKTDGQFIYVLRSSTLLIADAWPADSAEVVSSITVEGSPLEMFVQDDIAAVYSSLPSWAAEVQQKLGIDPYNYDSDSPIWMDSNITKLTVYDISDRTNPTPVRETYAQGQYVSARMVNSTARAVVRTGVDVDAYIDVYAYGGGAGGGSVGSPGVAVDVDREPGAAPSSGGSASAGSGSSTPNSTEPADEPESEESEDKADVYYDEPYNPLTEEELEAAKNDLKATIDATPLSAMIPRAWTVTNPGSDTPEIIESQLADCSDVYKQSVSGGLGYLSVLTVDLASPAADIDTISLIGEGHNVYASGTSLYVASDIWSNWLWMMPEAQEDWQVTVIHRFDITLEGAAAGYVASGKVPGHVLNQFSMSEYQGNLRVASTKEIWSGEDESESYVTVLGLSGGELVQLGQVGGLGKGERIYSARFVDDKGYVVTFREIDPLYTLDLSDPANPQAVGELKIPGFSTYIHPMGNDHLLTIGEEVDPDGGWTQGMKLEIFDVSDFANPQSTQKYIFDGGYYSQALYEHKAFTYNAARGMLAIPVDGWGWETSVGGGVGALPPAEDPGAEDDFADGDDAPSDPVDGPEPTDDEGTSEEEDWEEEEWEDDGWEDDYNENYKVGLGLFSIDPTAGIEEVAFVDHADVKSDDGGYSYYGQEVMRSLFITDGSADYLYSIGFSGMVVTDVTTLEPAAMVTFPADYGQNYEEGWGKEEPPVDVGVPEPAPAPDSPDSDGESEDWGGDSGGSEDDGSEDTEDSPGSSGGSGGSTPSP